VRAELLIALYPKAETARPCPSREPVGVRPGGYPVAVAIANLPTTARDERMSPVASATDSSYCAGKQSGEVRPVVDQCVAAGEPALATERASSPYPTMLHHAGIGVDAGD